MNVLRLALLLLGDRRLKLRLQLRQMRRNLRQHRLNALHGEHGSAAAFFQHRNIGANVGSDLRRIIAMLSQNLQIALRLLHLGFQPALLLLVLEQFDQLRGNEILPIAVLFVDSLQLALVR